MDKLRENWVLLRSQKINKKMVPVKIFGAFLNLGIMAIFPYLPLQMSEMGLTFNDISIVSGTIPAFTFLGGPISG